MSCGCNGSRRCPASEAGAAQLPVSSARFCPAVLPTPCNEVTGSEPSCKRRRTAGRTNTRLAGPFQGHFTIAAVLGTFQLACSSISRAPMPGQRGRVESSAGRRASRAAIGGGRAAADGSAWRPALLMETAYCWLGRRYA